MSPNPDYGVSYIVRRELPISVNVKQNYSLIDRLNWMVNGIFLLSEGIYVFDKYLQFFGKQYMTLPLAFVQIAVLTGIVNIVSGFFPTLQWNKRTPLLLTKAEILFILSLSLVLLGEICIDYELQAGQFCVESFFTYLKNFIGLF
jgi:hypothetical protein